MNTPVDIFLSEPQFRQQVCWLLGRSLSKTWVYRLRSDLNFTGLLTYDHAKALAYYAQLRRARVDQPTAIAKTIQFIEEHGL
jgi:hypothetical protein